MKASHARRSALCPGLVGGRLIKLLLLLVGLLVLCLLLLIIRLQLHRR